MNFDQEPTSNESAASEAEVAADLPTRDQVNSLVGELDRIDGVLSQLDTESEAA